MKRYLPSRKFIFYSIIGCSGVALDFVSFAILTHFLDWHYLLANVVSTTLGITNNFIWNAKLNFKVSDRLWTRFVRFYLIGLLGLIVASASLWLMVELAGFAEIPSKFATIVLVVLLQYNLNSRFSFSTRQAS